MPYDDLIYKLLELEHVLTNKEYYKYIDSLAKDYNINIMETNDSKIIARYIDYSNTLIFNYTNILLASYTDLTHRKFIDNNIKLYYVNLKMTQILLHEIEHIKQQYKNDILYEACVKRELELRSCHKYNLSMYICDPLERIANINSLELIQNSLGNIEENELYRLFKYLLYNELITGYFYNEYLYPINSFFEIKKNLLFNGYDAITIGGKIDIDEYIKIKEKALNFSIK